MYDDPSDERAEKFQQLLALRTKQIGRPAYLKNARTRGTHIELINVPPEEQQAFRDGIYEIFGAQYTTEFITVPEMPGRGAAFWAKVGRQGIVGEMEIEPLPCGCRAAQIPGEEDWQLDRSPDCTLEVHTPRYLRNRA